MSKSASPPLDLLRLLDELAIDIRDDYPNMTPLQRHRLNHFVLDLTRYVQNVHDAVRQSSQLANAPTHPPATTSP